MQWNLTLQQFFHAQEGSQSALNPHGEFHVPQAICLLLQSLPSHLKV